MEPAIFSDEYFMKIALREAETAASKGEIPVGAIVVFNNMIVARAHNLTETLNDVTAHAEMQVITAAANALGSKYLTECTLFVTLEPCPMCAGALHWAQITRLVFGAFDNKRGHTLMQPRMLHPKTAVTPGVMKNECGTVLYRFF
ncbi:MAG: nucleoside deaminase [Bacteroidales bacterium]|nr:nucleoside deaminase [Bacteroidales bacterium]